MLLQIGAALFYYKLWQTLLQIGAASLLQIRASVNTNWDRYYKLGQSLLQNRAAITNLYKTYYKLGQVLQIRAIITNWGIARSKIAFKIWEFIYFVIVILTKCNMPVKHLYENKENFHCEIGM